MRRARCALHRGSAPHASHRVARCGLIERRAVHRRARNQRAATLGNGGALNNAGNCAAPYGAKNGVSMAAAAAWREMKAKISEK
jgi:hypothetical protein